MNESVDISLMAAKLAAKDNKAASLVVHGLSATYNIAQMAHYRYAYCIEQNLVKYGLVQAEVLQRQALEEQYRQEMIKHTILSVLDITSLLLMSLSSFEQGKR